MILIAAEDGGVVLPGHRRHGRLQDAVDAVLDDHGVVVGFDMNIGSAALERGEDVVSTRRMMGLMSSVSLVSRSMEMFFVGVLVARQHVEGQAFAGSSRTRCDCSVFLSRSVDLREGGNAGMNALPSRPAISSSTMRREGSLTAMTKASVRCSMGTKL